MTPNNFSDYYKLISDTELIDVLEHQENYQPVAVEAAKREFENRKLSDEEINKSKQPLVLHQFEKDERRKTFKIVESKVRNAAHTFVNTLQPVQTETPSADKLIRLISITFFALFLFKVVSDYRVFFSMVNDIGRFDRSTFFYFFPFVILPTASITFWMRKTFGWMLSAFFIVYSAIGVIWMLIESLKFKSTATYLDNLFPRPSPVVYIVLIAFLIGMLYIISKSSIREIFKINRERLIATLFMSSLVTVFLMLEL